MEPEDQKSAFVGESLTNIFIKEGVEEHGYWNYHVNLCFLTTPMEHYLTKHVISNFVMLYWGSQSAFMGCYFTINQSRNFSVNISDKTSDDVHFVLLHLHGNYGLSFKIKKNPDFYTKTDVSDMISNMKAYLTDYFTHVMEYRLAISQ